MLILEGVLFEGKSVSGVYIDSSGANGKPVIIACLITIAVYLNPTVKVIKRRWTGYDECYDPFVKDR